MKKQKKLIILIIILVVILIGIKIATKPDDKKIESKIIWNEKEMAFSRVSFFNTQKHKASLAIPEHWEGRYRMKDEGTTVVFLNIDDPQNPTELFRIKSINFTEDKSGFSEEWEELYKQDDTQFVYKLSTGQLRKDENDDGVLKMLLESVHILKSFKAK